jgi:hypothetical protein
MEIFVFLFLAVICQTNPNFQDRILYYSESDNVCLSGERSDTINLTLILNYSETMRIKAAGATSCNDWKIRYSQQIQPGTRWSTFVNEFDSITFNE